MLEEDLSAIGGYSKVLLKEVEAVLVGGGIGDLGENRAKK